MNSNGDANHNNFNVDNQRGGGQPGRYRGIVRRGRGRGSNQDRAQSRGGRDKRSSNLRVAHPQRSTMNEFIDLNDSSQFPSIMESSSGTAVRQRPQQPPQINQNSTTPPVEVNAAESHSQRSSLSFRTAPPRVGSYSQSGQNEQGTGSMYQSRDYPNRYGSNRVRGPRYGNSNRAYTNSYNRRYVRAPFQNVANPYPADPMLSGYFNGHFMVSSNYQSQYASDQQPRPKEIDPMKQVEYYFSVPNLEHDIYLRSHMDQEGWVDIDVIHRFKRIQALELSFEDFLSRLLASEVLEIDSEKKKVRTKFDPQRWVIDTDKNLFQITGDVEQSQAMAASLDPYNAPSYNVHNPNQVYSNFPPFFLPLPSYPNAPHGHGRGRYPQYQVYPTSYLGMPYTPDMQSEGGFNYYPHGEYSVSYAADSSQGYSNPAVAKEQVTGGVESFQNSSDTTQAESYTDKRPDKNEEIDEVTSKIGRMGVNPQKKN